MNPSSVEPDFSAYVKGTSGLLGLELAAGHRPGVLANLEQLHAIAVTLLAFPITGHEEIAPVFLP